MRRELKIVRSILLEVEAAPTPHVLQESISVPWGDTPLERTEARDFHCALLIDAGFLDDTPEGLWLTWAGHEYLDGLRERKARAPR